MSTQIKQKTIRAKNIKNSLALPQVPDSLGGVMTTQQNPTAAIELLAKLNTKQLIDAFNATANNSDKEIPTVRGWIMDELERRNPDAFLAWLEGDANKGPELYF